MLEKLLSTWASYIEYIDSLVSVIPYDYRGPIGLVALLFVVGYIMTLLLNLTVSNRGRKVRPLEKKNMKPIWTEDETEARNRLEAAIDDALDNLRTDKVITSERQDELVEIFKERMEIEALPSPKPIEVVEEAKEEAPTSPQAAPVTVQPEQPVQVKDKPEAKAQDEVLTTMKAFWAKHEKPNGFDTIRSKKQKRFIRMKNFDHLPEDFGKSDTVVHTPKPALTPIVPQVPQKAPVAPAKVEPKPTPAPAAAPAAKVEDVGLGEDYDWRKNRKKAA